MERKCIYCDTVIDLKKHGLTKFCSATCRNKFYYQNKSQKEINDITENTLNEAMVKNETTPEKKEEIVGSLRLQDIPVHAGTRSNDSFIYSLIEAKFDAKNDCNLYKLKCEQLEEEKRRLEKELFDANSELDSLDESEVSSPFSFLSGLPENVIAGVSKAAFENEHIRNIISSLVSSKK
jgi:predicted  nucleic acid-binding Zn-ribbon protein